MKYILVPAFFILFYAANGFCQNSSIVKAANNFATLLDEKQKVQVMYPYESPERFVWGYIPKNDRKGISWNELDASQQKAAIGLMRSCLSEKAYQTARSIMKLELVLKALEQRSENDHYRDTGKYFITLFGQPARQNLWGWRLDGHHLSFSFSSKNNQLVSGTPGFLGANPAVVLSGPEKGLEILKPETEMGLKLINSLNHQQLKKAIVNPVAPGDILTTTMRKAFIDGPEGLSYSEMDGPQQQILKKLLQLYIQRYTHLFAQSMMQEIKKAGLQNLYFAWAGSTEDGPGHPKYYRIKGPTIIIEYDNTQNNGNHVHTVTRDLINDFGDPLTQHYQNDHQ